GDLARWLPLAAFQPGRAHLQRHRQTTEGQRKKAALPVISSWVLTSRAYACQSSDCAGRTPRGSELGPIPDLPLDDRAGWINGNVFRDGGRSWGSRALECSR